MTTTDTRPGPDGNLIRGMIWAVAITAPAYALFFGGIYVLLAML